MNYAAHYDRLIARAIGRVLHGYSERHHVLPRCLGGGNEATNIVALTAEEHFCAHLLLVRMYPEHHGLIHAAVLMSKKCTGNKAFGWLRRRKSDAMRGQPKTAEHRKHIAEAKRGVPRSAETKAKMSAAFIGKRRAQFSDETRERMSAWQRGRKFSQKTKDKQSAMRKGKPWTAAQRSSREQYYANRNLAALSEVSH